MFPIPQRDANLTQAENEAAQREHRRQPTREDEKAAEDLLELASGSSDGRVNWHNDVLTRSNSTHHAARRSIEEEMSPAGGVPLVPHPYMQPVTGVPPHARLPVVPAAANSTRGSILPRAVSAADSAGTETPGPSDLRCAFEEPGAAEPCVMGDTARKCTSEKFGRNKACTKKLPSHWWNYSCRKHYQRKKYEASHNGRFPEYQRECIINQINKFLTFAHSFEFDIKWQLNVGATIEEYDHMMRMGTSRVQALNELTDRYGASLNSRAPLRLAAMDKFKAQLDVALKVNYLCGDNKTVDQVFVFIDRMFSRCQRHPDIKDLELPHIEFLPKRWVLLSVPRAPFTLVSQSSQSAPTPAPAPSAPHLGPLNNGFTFIRRGSDREQHPRRESRSYEPVVDSEMANTLPYRPSETGQGRLPTPPSSSFLMPPPPPPASRRSPAPGLAPLQTSFGTGFGTRSGPVRNHVLPNGYGFPSMTSTRTDSHRAEPYPVRRY